MPHVYMSRDMYLFHENNPELKRTGKPISEEAWHMKLEAIAKYLRGQSETLDLNPIVNHRGEYAFHHISYQ